ncbi:uncharacterized protein LOC126902258 isoform X2 [Daktulosphaira vitifoliae]|uniref:uncharacterized protein LOC126902258 isoform X2 n=1 Tax=Daktulosphaira vitifoliae TaxID=58002 RepID=UPI0021AA03F6|nr:uncharacterized protein LOC126902258 isoform X2 [Daktulosphaira vitifoliae]
MKLLLYLTFMMYLYVFSCGYTNYLQCSHTRYFLNFFNHNERFLLEFENNKDYITIENVMNYGKALQTHSKVIMIFLDDLINNNIGNFPYTLMTVNMYLNNVSGSLNMITLNEDDKKNDAEKLLEGYKVIHHAVKEQLRDYINQYCKNKLFYENVDRILMKFNLTIKRNSYEYYHPKYILFYDIMTQQILNNENNIIKIDNGQHIVLNLLRFTPLNVKCTDGTRLTIQDVFEYIKYDFNSKDVLPYIKMVIVATFRPIAILIRNFLTLIQVTFSENSDSVTYWLKSTLIKMGRKIINYLIEFISLSVFNEERTIFLESISSRFIQILNFYTIIKDLSNIDNKNINILIELLSQFFIKNKLYFTPDIVLTKENITENNADDIKNQLEKIMQKVVIYLFDLKKWNYYFNFIARKFKIRSFSVSNYNNFIDSKVLDYICNTEAHSEIYNASEKYSNKIDIGHYEDVDDVNEDYYYYWKIITTFNLEDVKDDHDENEINTNDSFENQSTYKPLYMIDYLPYNI